MRRAEVVIGAGFGDEGKGLVTDFLATGYGMDAIVVRYNGGAQAGHSVERPDGRRHVFSHFGSGSFVGSATYLSRFFVCNPLQFLREKPKLSALGLAPVVYADPDCIVTTPYDMMINQMVEDKRQGKKHGSCGLGFGETIERNSNPAFAFTFSDLRDRKTLKKKLLAIRQQWVPARLRAHNIEEISEEWRTRINSDDILDCYLVSAEQFLDYVTPAAVDLLLRNRPVIFEGAQGLLLDQDWGWFPHVTRSHTGLKNVMVLAREAGFEKLDVTYVTRAYAARHGAGPMPHELSMPPYSRIEDRTNLGNPHQGDLRFGWLDLDLLARSIVNDRLEKVSGVDVSHRLAVTCLDHVDDKVTYIAEARLHSASVIEFLHHTLHMTQSEQGLASFGPHREDVEIFKLGDRLIRSLDKEVLDNIA